MFNEEFWTPISVPLAKEIFKNTVSSIWISEASYPEINCKLEGNSKF